MPTEQKTISVFLLKIVTPVVCGRVKRKIISKQLENKLENETSRQVANKRFSGSSDQQFMAYSEPLLEQDQFVRSSQKARRPPTE